MRLEATSLKDCYILHPKVFGDARGFFFESFNQKVFSELTGVEELFVQDNHSRSSMGVLRGLHYQLTKPQGKLVRVLQGRIYDVVVDLRKKSPTFGRHFGTFLSAEEKQQIWVPPGFAHGFVVLDGIAEVAYKTTEYYAPEDEKCILWNDPVLDIDWRTSGDVILSAKDQQGLLFKDAPCYG
ncbi:dTDP-4-dehydrorhamnose 3,5-epimerase [Bdellovibrio sp. HCB-110]|uniref:dTDP-4-dehydrorhamnose 3,5-epimerase n=1 Tax=Bdellovibrio sp. HCB-110 TaxID=3391182 RepID=UPI0039B4718F